MEYRAYAKMILARWHLILLLCLAGAAGSLVYSARAPRIFRATAQLSVTASIIEYWTGQAVERQLNNYAWRLRSRLFAQEVAAQLPAGTGTGDLGGSQIRAVAAPAEFRIALEVDDADPSRAAEIANTAARYFVAKMQAEAAGKERHDIAVEVGEFAGVPTSPVSPRPKVNAAAGALLGALVGCLLAALLEYLDDSIRTARDVQELLALPVLGILPAQPSSPAAESGFLRSLLPASRPAIQGPGPRTQNR